MRGSIYVEGFIDSYINKARHECHDANHHAGQMAVIATCHRAVSNCASWEHGAIIVLISVQQTTLCLPLPKCTLITVLD